MTTSVDGLISGLSTTDTIAQLMAVERQGQTRLTQAKTANESLITTYQGLNSRFLALKDVASKLSSADDWLVNRAGTTDVTIASATATSSALSGSLTFRVQQLATNQALVSSGTVSSTSAVVVTPNTHYLVAATNALGISTATASNDLALGSHTVTVTQSSAGAAQESHTLGTTITILPNTTVEVATDGSTSTTQTLTLAGGTYTRAELTDLITTASGGSLKATFTNEGKLRLATTREGSAAQLAITGGSALTELGLSVSAAASAGTDGIVTVDGQATTLTDLSSGTTASLAAQGGGSINVTLNGGLREGTAKTVNVDLGDGKLSTVTTAINAAGVGFKAAAVQVSAGTYRVQLSATSSGSDGRITSDTSLFDTAFGGLNTLTAGDDASILVGSGAAAYTVTSSANKVELMPGVTVQLNKKDPSTDVTLNVSTDTDALASKVGSLIDAVNSALTFVSSQSKYDAASKKGGPLLSDNTSRSLQRRLYDAFGTAASTLGITVGKDASIQFDKSKFVAAYQADPTAIQNAFTDETSGLAAKLETIGKNATDTVSGIITTAISGKQALSKNLTDQISNWDTRLSLRENELRRTFGNLEVMLGKLKSQSAWLSGQISSLPTYSTS